MSAIDSLTRPRTLAVLLAVSLAVNLFLAGIFAGRLGAQRYGPHPMPVFGLGGPGFESGFRFMPRGEREHIRSLLRERRPELKEQHEAMRALHRDIAEELKREVPDRALIDAKLAEIRAQTAKIEQAMQTAFLDRMLAMKPAERQQLLERMLKHRHHRMPPPGDGPDMADPEAPPAFEMPLPPPAEAEPAPAVGE